jgi:myo-inositol-1(or 4)-monophosphatase
MIDQAFLDKVCTISIVVGQYMAAEQQKLRPGQVEIKALNSLVSYVDKTAEEKLVVALAQMLPGSTFLTEENTVEQGNGEWQWIIDPLDGTTNFIHGLPVYGISIALRHRDEIVLGVVHAPALRETFTALKGKGAALNGRQIHVSANEKLSDSLLATGFPYYDFDRLEQYIKSLQHFITQTRGLRRMGSAAIDLCFTACGRFDGFFEYSLSPWDVAAGGLIVQEAGGMVYDFQGGDEWLFGKEIIAGNAAIVRALADQLH